MPVKGLVNEGMSIILFKGVYKMGKGHREVDSRWLFICRIRLFNKRTRALVGMTGALFLVWEILHDLILPPGGIKSKWVVIREILIGRK